MSVINQNECAVCCLAFNKKTRSIVPCGCNYQACKTCVQTYLLGTTTDPNCMNCNIAWSDKFLSSYLNSSFVKTKYKIHRKELLVQQEISRIPESMAEAETYKRVLDINTQISALKECIKRIEKEVMKKYNWNDNRELLLKGNKDMYTMRKNIKSMKHDIAVIQAGGEPAQAQAQQGQAEQAQAEQEQGQAEQEQRQAQAEHGQARQKEKKKFIMPCPGTDCRGYLSSDYKCEICQQSTCDKCFEIIIDATKSVVHLCKKENIESAEFIRKQSKPCPCCGSRISKIDGCDQMWCTQCHKAFSWNKGTVVTGTIHNPHYYQYHRERGGGVAPRNPGDIPCGGLCNMNELVHVLNTKLSLVREEKIVDELLNIHREVVHLRMVDLGPLRRQLGIEINNQSERVKYIVKEISREKLAELITKKDYKRRRETDLVHVCELFVNVSSDIFLRVLRSEQSGPSFIKELEQCLVELHTLIDYCNGQFKEVSITYGICVPLISLTKQRRDERMNTKYNSKGETDSYIIKRQEENKKRHEENEKRRKEYALSMEKQRKEMEEKQRKEKEEKQRKEKEEKEIIIVV